MIATLLLAALLAAAPKPPATPEASYSAAQASFARGEFDAALAALDAATAAASASNVPFLVQVELLRGQSCAALNRTPDAQAAFLRALELNPEAKLDAARVRPSVVALLDDLRGRTLGALEVSGDVTGAEVLLDEASIGTVPFAGNAPIGKHVVRLRSKEGTLSETREVLVQVKGSQRVALSLGPPPVAPPPPPPQVETRFTLGGLVPFADVRGALEPVPPHGTGLAGGGEVGVGLGGKYLLGSLHGGVGGRSFAMALRATGQLPQLISVVGLHLSLDVPAMVVSKKFAPGLGGAAGVDLALTRWLEPFIEVQYRHYFALSSAYASNAALLGLGARLRLP